MYEGYQRSVVGLSRWQQALKLVSAGLFEFKQALKNGLNLVLMQNFKKKKIRPNITKS